MARTVLTLRATTSDGIQFRLMSGITGIDLSAVGTVELHLKDKSGGTSMTNNLTGKLNVNGAGGGSVLWTPGTADLVAGSAPYTVYFKCYVTASSWYFCPEDSELTINVRDTF